MGYLADSALLMNPSFSTKDEMYEHIKRQDKTIRWYHNMVEMAVAQYGAENELRVHDRVLMRTSPDSIEWFNDMGTSETVVRLRPSEDTQDD